MRDVLYKEHENERITLRNSFNKLFLSKSKGFGLGVREHMSFRIAVIIGVVLFMVYPILGIFTFVLAKMVYNKRDRLTDNLLFGLIALFICLIQSARTWQFSQPTDWYSDGYYDLFHRSATIPFFTYVFGGLKEPFWNLLNYFGYQLTSGDYFIFINGITIFTLFLTCYSIFLFWRSTKADTVTLVASLALIVFFSEYLSNLNNITRQSFAISIVMYVFTIRVTQGKTLWFLLISACFIHTFSFIYTILFLIEPLHRKLDGKNLKRFLYALAGLVLVFMLLPFIGKMVSGIGFLAYGFKRFENNTTGAIDETVFDMGPLYVTASLMVGLCMYMIWKTKDRVYDFFTNVLMVLMIACLMLASTSEGLVSRLYISRMYLFPFVLPYVMLDKKILHTLYAWGIVLFFGIRFLMRFDELRGGGFFPLLSSLLSYSIFDFIF
ncbi:EpsG family protein [uncultured Zobellia sp.]|uniref:EpsG family protein n=1 Tax=uncultured Zobellia sp. TaxID=255433 RepID=UPI00259AAF92|nr:EpsG family protein [uncultured Zobellia sp.]